MVPIIKHRDHNQSTILALLSVDSVWSWVFCTRFLIKFGTKFHANFHLKSEGTFSIKIYFIIKIGVSIFFKPTLKIMLVVLELFSAPITLSVFPESPFTPFLAFTVNEVSGICSLNFYKKVRSIKTYNFSCKRLGCY